MHYTLSDQISAETVRVQEECEDVAQVQSDLLAGSAVGLPIEEELMQMYDACEAMFLQLEE